MEDEARAGSETTGACAVSKDAGKRNRRHRSSRLRQQKTSQQQQQQTTMATAANGSVQQSSSSQGDETADSSSSVDGGSGRLNKAMGLGGNISPTNVSNSSDGAGSEGLRRVGSAKGGVMFNLDESSTSNEENTEAEEELGPLGGRQPSLSSQTSLDAVSAAAAAIMTDPALHTPKMRQFNSLSTKPAL